MMVYFEVGGGGGEGILTLFIFLHQVLYFVRSSFAEAQAFIGQSFQRYFVLRRGSGTKSWDAQCKSAHVAMAARV